MFGIVPFFGHGWDAIFAYGSTAATTSLVMVFFTRTKIIAIFIFLINYYY
jgi:hypothetical protein